MCNAYTVRPKVMSRDLDGILSEEIARLPTALVRRLGKGVVVTEGSDGLIPRTMRWGFPHEKYKSVNNARTESLGRGMWVGPMAERRCLVPMSCFYEWQERLGGLKQPYEITVPHQEWLWVAGLHGQDAAGEPCYATITTEPTREFSRIHDRLLAIVSFEAGLAFLRGGVSMFKPYGGPLAANECASPLKAGKPKPDDPQGLLF